MDGPREEEKESEEASAGLVTESGLIQLIWDVGFACQWLTTIDAFRGDNIFTTVFYRGGSGCNTVLYVPYGHPFAPSSFRPREGHSCRRYFGLSTVLVLCDFHSIHCVLRTIHSTESTPTYVFKFIQLIITVYWQ